MPVRAEEMLDGNSCVAGESDKILQRRKPDSFLPMAPSCRANTKLLGSCGFLDPMVFPPLPQHVGQIFQCVIHMLSGNTASARRVIINPKCDKRKAASSHVFALVPRQRISPSCRSRRPCEPRLPDTLARGILRFVLVVGGGSREQSGVYDPSRHRRCQRLLRGGTLRDSRAASLRPGCCPDLAPARGEKGGGGFAAAGGARGFFRTGFQRAGSAGASGIRRGVFLSGAAARAGGGICRAAGRGRAEGGGLERGFPFAGCGDVSGILRRKPRGRASSSAGGLRSSGVASRRDPAGRACRLGGVLPHEHPASARALVEERADPSG